LPIDEERRSGGRLSLLASISVLENGWISPQRCAADRLCVKWEPVGPLLDQCDDALYLIGEC
jgi:hypothetical protein